MNAMEAQWPIFVCLAQNGYFLDNISSVESTSIKDVVQKPFSIRRGTIDDLDELVSLEIVWDASMRSSRDEIYERISCNSQNIWVAIWQLKVVGVIYTQRIPSVGSVTNGSTFAEHKHIATEHGSTLQLLAVAVDNSVKSMQIGKALRDFMIIQVILSSQLTDIIAVTRCSSFPPGKDYASYVAEFTDPTLRFHCDGGAEFVGIIANYRPEDGANLGNGVLIRYDLSAGAPLTTRPVQTVTRTEPLASEDISMDKLHALVMGLVQHRKDFQSVNMEKFSTSPFMTLGLDSLDMLQLSELLSSYGSGQTLSSTLLFDYPTPIAVLNYLREFNPDTNSACTHIDDRTHSDISKACTTKQSNDYAIVGMACRFPGGANSPESFFEMLSSEFDAVAAIPAAWNWPGRSKTGGVKCAAVLDDEVAENFDPDYFGISSAEAESMDPQQRLLLEVGSEALDQATCSGGPGADEKTGVFVGLCNTYWSAVELYSHMNNGASVANSSASAASKCTAAVGPYGSTGTSNAIAANRLSYLLNLTGPSMVIDTACSSSLVAIDSACKALGNNECRSALVATADLLLCPYTQEVRMVY
jgi:hypothetical protein